VRLAVRATGIPFAAEASDATTASVSASTGRWRCLCIADTIDGGPAILAGCGAAGTLLGVPPTWIWMQVTIVVVVLIGMVVAIVKLA
jgi:hypothetical protein